MLTSDTAVQVQQQDNNLVSVTNGHVSLEINLENGEVSCIGNHSSHVKGIRSAFRWQGREYSTDHYQNHELTTQGDIVREGFGKGIRLIVLHTASLLPQLEQHFYMYESSPYVLVQTAVAGDEELKANRMAVIQSKTISLGGESGQDEPSILCVPFDNDKWVRYTVVKPPLDVESYEATALFAPQSRRGIVMGSLTHKVWKTGIRMQSEKVDSLRDLICTVVP